MKNLYLETLMRVGRLAVFLVFCFAGGGFCSQAKAAIGPATDAASDASTLGGGPIFRLGDWNSQGDLQRPYIPTYAFAYSCQAQLSDGLERRDGNGNYHLYAIADFTLNNTQTAVNISDLKLVANRLYSRNNVVSRQEKIPFSTQYGSFSIWFKPGHSADTDRVSTYATIQQKIGERIVSNSSRQPPALRTETRLITVVAIDVVREDRAPTPSMSLRVVCERVK